MRVTRPTSILPGSLTQNPAPNPATQGQAAITEKAALVGEIMAAFRAALPSNYVAATNGPWYSLQFQAMAEGLAAIQLEATEVAVDAGWDFTRPDFLWETLGSLVFPAAAKTGIPAIDGDVAYRAFLQRIVDLLLSGATRTSMEGGIEALDPDVTAYVLERYLESPPRDPNGAYNIVDQFTVDVLVEVVGGTAFPADPIRLRRNVELVLSALKPAHVLWTYANLLRDSFGEIDDGGAPTFEIAPYYYDDVRMYCLGATSITGTAGEFLARRDLFSDPSRSFAAVRPGATLTVGTAVYRVRATVALPAGADPTARPYTTSGGLVGAVIATSETDLVDPLQDWGNADLDETITITSGPNAGTYRLETVLGVDGGPLGTPGLSGTRLRISPSTLRLDRRAPAAASGVTYTVTVDRLGAQVPKTVTAEDASNQFWL